MTRTETRCGDSRVMAPRSKTGEPGTGNREPEMNQSFSILCSLFPVHRFPPYRGRGEVQPHHEAPAGMVLHFYPAALALEERVHQVEAQADSALLLGVERNEETLQAVRRDSR